MGQARYFILAAVALSLALGGWRLLADDNGATVGDGAADPGRPAQPADRAAHGPLAGVGNVLFQVEPGVARVPGSDEDSFPVSIDRQAALAAARTGSMTVALPDGTRYPVRYERSESAPDGNWTFIGRVDTTLGALASVITFGRDGVFGTLPTPDGRMMKLTTRGGQAFLQPAGWSVPPGVDPSQHPDYVLPEPRNAAVARSATGTAAATIGQLAAAESGEVTITILAAYTRNLSQLRGSPAAAETEYRNLVALMNQAHIDSGTRARFEIAGFVELDYPADEWNQEARFDIIDNTLPDGTDLHGLRDQLAADLVGLIRPYVDGDLTCGISQFPGDELQSHSFFGGAGFSVTAVEACAPLVYAHEIGHNLGLMHDRETVAGPHGATLQYGAYPFSFGHRQLGPPGFATIMAYDTESRPWLGFFSHPGTTLCGGVACGDGALSDNVRAINSIAESISRFRNPPGMVFIGDEWILERDGNHFRSIFVRLTTPAPPGGVTFNVAVEGGTAVLGEDAAVDSNYLQQDLVIPEGAGWTRVDVRIVGDDSAESLESLTFRLYNVRGNVAVLDDEATLTIIDDDATVRIEGKVRLPSGFDAPPGEIVVSAIQSISGLTTWHSMYTYPPDYAFGLDVRKGSFVKFEVDPVATLMMQDVILEEVDRPMPGLVLEPREQVRFYGSVIADGGERVTGVPVALWNPHGDGRGYYVNWLSDLYTPNYGKYVLPGTSMQLEIRDPPLPYVRQIVELPPLAQEGSVNLRLREVPSLTIPHVTVPEGRAADGERTVLLTASLSVPKSETGVTFDLVAVGTADADDFRLPSTHISIPVDRTRVEVPIVVVGDDRREGDETIELRITNVVGAAWNPGPGSLTIATDDGRPGDGLCTGAATGVRMCQ